VPAAEINLRISLCYFPLEFLARFGLIMECKVFASLKMLMFGGCCNLSVGFALNARFTTNGMCTKNNTIYRWREQGITE